jgi:hypothetical protein
MPADALESFGLKSFSLVHFFCVDLGWIRRPRVDWPLKYLRM